MHLTALSDFTIANLILVQRERGVGEKATSSFYPILDKNDILAREKISSELVTGKNINIYV